MTEEKIHLDSRLYTTNGRKKNQGKLAFVNGQVALCFTEGKDEKVTGYTPLRNIMEKSCGLSLPSL